MGLGVSIPEGVSSCDWAQSRNLPLVGLVGLVGELRIEVDVDALAAAPGSGLLVGKGSLAASTQYEFDARKLPQAAVMEGF